MAIALGVAGLLVVPIIAVPVMILTGTLWRRAPRWARITLIAVALAYAVYRLITTPVHM